MSTAKNIAELIANKDFASQLIGHEETQKFQSEYRSLLQKGLIKKKKYNIAPINVIGASTPGQTKFKIYI
jgi:hypothetical protein